MVSNTTRGCEILTGREPVTRVDLDLLCLKTLNNDVLERVADTSPTSVRQGALSYGVRKKNIGNLFEGVAGNTNRFFCHYFRFLPENPHYTFFREYRIFRGCSCLKPLWRETNCKTCLVVSHHRCRMLVACQNHGICWIIM